MAGRRTKYTPETVDKIIAGVRAGLTNRDAALIAGVCDDTLANWEKRHSEFSDRLTRARAERAGNWIARIQTLANEQRDIRAYFELLDRCAPEYRKTNRHEVSGPDGAPIQHEHALLAQAVQRIAEEQGLDVADVLAQADDIIAEVNS